MSAENKNPSSVSHLEEKETGQTWDIDRDGNMVVDVRVLLKQPKVQKQIEKAREIMKRFPPQGAGQ